MAAGRGSFLYQDYQIAQCDETHLYHPFPLNNVQQSYYLGRIKVSISARSLPIFIMNLFSTILITTNWSVPIINLLHAILRCAPYLKRENSDFKCGSALQNRLPPLRNEDELLALRAEYSHKVYKPDCYPLFDIFLSEYQGKYLLHVSFDAIIIDMTSFEILFGEWIALYHDENLVLPPLDISYRDYQLQYERLRGGALFERAQQYWLQKIDDYTLEAGLPLAAHPARIDKPSFRRLSATIPMSSWQKSSTNASASILVRPL